MKAKSILFSKPIKDFPERLIYRSSEASRVPDGINGSKTFVYTYKMYDTKAKAVVGLMKAGPVNYKNKRCEIYPMDTPYNSYYISYLETVDSGYNYGTDLINLAKNESMQSYCEGRVHLVASRTFSPRRPPHLFYRKLGFQTNSSFLNDVMDFYVSIGEQLPWEYSGNVMMYTPVAIKNPKKRSIFSFMVNFLKEKFTKK